MVILISTEKGFGKIKYSFMIQVLKKQNRRIYLVLIKVSFDKPRASIPLSRG